MQQFGGNDDLSISSEFFKIAIVGSELIMVEVGLSGRITTRSGFVSLIMWRDVFKK